MTDEELMLFVVKQPKFTRNVVTCYDAGAFGVHLHRWLEKLGIKNYVAQNEQPTRCRGVEPRRLVLLLIKTVPEQPKNPPITWRAAISQVAIQFGARFLESAR
jgi:hypothetical protein